MENLFRIHNAFVMRHVCLFIVFVFCLSAKSQNTCFYQCDSLLDVYYETKDYERLLHDWRQIPSDSIPCLAHADILHIMIDHDDEMFSRQTIYHLIRKYGFDFKKFSDVYRIKDTWVDGAVADSLFQAWYAVQPDEVKRYNSACQSFLAKEKRIYQGYMRQDLREREERYASFALSLDSLFEDLMTICVGQGFLPNMEANGHGNDVSLALSHILSVSRTETEERWCRVYPYVDAAFGKGMISNSCCFVYDRISYEQQRCQNFGTLDDKVPFCDCMCGEDVDALKAAYLIPLAYSFIQRNKYWLSIVDGD